MDRVVFLLMLAVLPKNAVLSSANEELQGTRLLTPNVELQGASDGNKVAIRDLYGIFLRKTISPKKSKIMVVVIVHNFDYAGRFEIYLYPKVTTIQASLISLLPD